MNLHTVAATVVITGAAALMSACSEGPTEYSVEGSISRITPIGKDILEDGGSYFSLGNDLKTYFCYNERFNECATLRVGDTVKMTIKENGDSDNGYVVGIDEIRMGSSPLAPSSTT